MKIVFNYFAQVIKVSIQQKFKALNHLIVLQYGIERAPAPVEEVLVADVVEIRLPLVGAPEQRLREPLQGPQVGLVYLTGHVDGDPKSAEAGVGRDF